MSSFSDVRHVVGDFILENANQRQITIMTRIYPAMCETNMIEKFLIPLITQTSPISLRALDWLVTNHSKKNNIVCQTKKGTLFNIYHGYKNSLAHFRRRNFDPFRRRQRIILVYKDKEYDTTVGQCNFVHWAYFSGVLQYAIDNENEIETDMNTAALMNKNERKTQNEKGIPHKRRELSKAPVNKCSVYKVDSHVVFNTSAESDSE
jgi:hypothetical protein